MAALRMAGLFLEVSKVERHGGGDLCRSRAIVERQVGPDGLLFPMLNRKKVCVAADLKNLDGRERLCKLRLAYA